MPKLSVAQKVSKLKSYFEHSTYKSLYHTDRLVLILAAYVATAGRGRVVSARSQSSNWIHSLANNTFKAVRYNLAYFSIEMNP